MRLLILLLILSLAGPAYCQSRTISGKIIGELDLLPIPGVKIYADTIQLATTDLNGGFEIQAPANKDELRFAFLGMETTSIKAPSDCNRLEIIMMADFVNDYASTTKINRDHHRRVEALPKKHRTAYEKHVFTSPSPCFTYKDIDLKEQARQFKAQRKRDELLKSERSQNTKKLKVGDTVSVVFSRNATKDGYYLSLMSYTAPLEKPTNCFIKGRIIEKNKVKGSYNLRIEVITTSNCDKSNYEGTPMIKGRTFSYNMTYFNLKATKE